MDATALHALAAACSGVLLCGDGTTTVTTICKDTRTLQSGDLYWALVGDNFDGHDFVGAAAASGAAGAVGSRSVSGLPDTFPLIRVDDTLSALQQLASWYRGRLKARVICLTGSNGKTSTKDFAAAVAATRFVVNKTEGNLNNHIGLPLTILSATTQDEVCVWEIGMNRAGEIGPLSRLAGPAIGLITNIGVAHIEFLGSRQAIAQEKGMLGEVLPADAVLILPVADDFTSSLAARTKARVVLAGGPEGLHAENLRPSACGLDFDFVLGRDEPAVDRRGVFPRPAFHRSAEGFEFLVEKSALRCGVVALLPHHRYLLAGRLEAIAGGPVERPGHHRRQPRAHEPQRCKSPGERPGDGGRQKEPREDHRCPGDEHRAQPEEPFKRDQLPAEMEGHVAIEGGE